MCKVTVRKAWCDLMKLTARYSCCFSPYLYAFISSAATTFQVAIKIVYADVGANLVRVLSKYLPNEIANMEKGFGHPNIVGFLSFFVTFVAVLLALYVPLSKLVLVFIEKFTFTCTLNTTFEYKTTEIYCTPTPCFA